MHIYFIGIGEGSREALAQEAVKNGYTATLTDNNSVLRSCIGTIFLKPNIIHVQGIQAGVYIRILSPFLKHTTKIWTISALPTPSNRFLQYITRKIVQYAAIAFDSVCASSRTVQYSLLTAYSVKAEYIPDGYTEPVLSDIRPALFGLRKEQYGVVFAENTAQVKQISSIYKSLRSKKKLIIFSSAKHTAIQSVDLPLYSRGAQSLIRQAGFVISTNPLYCPLLLQAMDAGRAIIATTHSLHEELLGTTAAYYKENDSIELLKLLSEASKKHPLNTAAQVRAKNHFTWQKISREYMRTYRHSKAVLVPFDSIIRNPARAN